MPQDNMHSNSAQLLYELLKAISLDEGAAIQHRSFGTNDPKLRFFLFTNTERPELLQFFFPEMEGLTQLRNTSPDAFDRDGGGCDLAPVYEALLKNFEGYWTNCKEWVEGNLASSNATWYYWSKKRKLPESRDNLKSSLIMYERDDSKVSSLNDIFSHDPSVRRFMDAYGGGTVTLNDVTAERLEEKDEIEAIVSISMIWLAQLGASDTRCKAFREKLYEKIRLLFLEDDPRIPDVLRFREIASFAFLDVLAYSCIIDVSMVDLLGDNCPMDYLEEMIDNLMLDLTNHADVSSDNAKQRTLRYEEM